jgi:hypothetical protein
MNKIDRLLGAAKPFTLASLPMIYKTYKLKHVICRKHTFLTWAKDFHLIKIRLTEPDERSYPDELLFMNKINQSKSFVFVMQ